MKHYSFLFLIILLLIKQILGNPVLAQTTPQHPFPQHSSYAPKTIKPNHWSQIQLDDHVRAFYDDWKAKYVISAGSTANGKLLYRISCGKKRPNCTVSEGQGYGMVIVALMAGYDSDAQGIFDGLWLFSREHPSIIDSRLMAWEVPANDGDSAFDGDADIAYGLLLANSQWGSDENSDYASAAKTVITAIFESTIGPTSRLPLLGDWVEPLGHRYNEYTVRSSDFMPAHFRAFARFTNNTDWNTVVAKLQTAISKLQSLYSPKTGLLPDFIVYKNNRPQPAPARFLEDTHDGQYYYNAGRDPWRIATDALLNNNPTSLAQARKMSKWIQLATKNNPLHIRAGYQLNGTPLKDSNYFSSFFVAPFGVAAMTNPSQQQWLNAIYDAVRETHDDYYEDTVTLLALLVMTGNYWDPTNI